MAEFDAIAWSQINAPKATKRDFNADFAESLGTSDALRSGQPANRAMVSGIQARQTMLDPMYELNRAKLQTDVLTSAQRFQEGILSQKIRQKQIDDEAADNLSAANIVQQAGGDMGRMLPLLNRTMWKSARGIQNAIQWRTQITSLRNADRYSKIASELTGPQQAKLIQFEQGSPEWVAEIEKFAESTKPQSPFGKLQADLDAELSGPNRPEVVKRYLEAIETASTNRGVGADPGALVGVEVSMPDGSTVQAIRNTQGKGYTVVPKKSELDADVASKESTRKITSLESDARAIERQMITVNADLASAMSGKTEFDDEAKALQAKAKSLKAARDEKLNQLEVLRVASSSDAGPNITQPEYEKLNPGDLYWWNGKQIPKR